MNAVDRPSDPAGHRQPAADPAGAAAQGKGGGLSDMFGGGMSSRLGGSSVAERNLDRITIGVGLIWFACIVGLGCCSRPADPVSSAPCHPVRRKDDAWQVATQSGEAGSARPDGRGRARRGRAPRSSSPSSAPTGTRPGRASPGAAAVIPETWDCPRCGLPAGQDSENPPAPPQDRALQDAPRLREGASLRRRGRGDPRRGARHPAPPPSDPVGALSLPGPAGRNSDRLGPNACIHKVVALRGVVPSAVTRPGPVGTAPRR